MLKDAPSPTLRGADLRVWASNDRDVTLDGAVRGIEDSALAEWLAGSVPGVSHVHNRLIAMPAVATATSESLVNRGISFLDAGDYASAIDCFRQASADPINKAAKELLDQALRAQQTEEELLKNRQQQFWPWINTDFPRSKSKSLCLIRDSPCDPWLILCALPSRALVGGLLQNLCFGLIGGGLLIL